MSHDEINLQGMGGVDLPDPPIPLLNQNSSNPERHSTKRWGRLFHSVRRSLYPYHRRPANSVKVWVQTFRLAFKHRTATYSAIETTREQSTPLTRQDLEAILDVSTVDDGPRFASVEHLGPWFPEADPAHPEAQTFRIWRSKRQIALGGCAIIAFLTLLINVSSTIYFKMGYETDGDLGRLYHGECSQSHRLSSGLHVLINVLSTALLAASNLCMQLLVAPTRREIDEAHGKYVWLDIGVPSFRNLKHIGRRRTMAVFLLAASSIPLHLVWVWLKIS